MPVVDTGCLLMECGVNTGAERWTGVTRGECDAKINEEGRKR